MTRLLSAGLMLGLVISAPIPAHARGGGVVKTLVTVLTGAGAAEALRRSGQSYEQYKSEDAILKRLKEQGVDAQKSSIYSVSFRTTGGRWADFWSHPDVFFIVDIEGVGSSLVPQIHYNYRGEPVLDVVVASTVRPGSQIVVRVLDDDTTSDAMWNSILNRAKGTGAYIVSVRRIQVGERPTTWCEWGEAALEPLSRDVALMNAGPKPTLPRIECWHARVAVTIGSAGRPGDPGWRSRPLTGTVYTGRTL